MKLGKFISLCALTLHLASCNSNETEVDSKFASEIPQLLVCASSTVDESANIHQPDYYTHGGDYGLSGTFKDRNGKERYFYLHNPQDPSRLETRFNDDLGNIQVTHHFSTKVGDGISLSRANWPGTLVKSVDPSPIDEEQWKQFYHEFLVWAHATVKKTCDENPFAREITTVSEYDSAISATTKPTLVDFKAKWCGPCTYFEIYDLRPFMRQNLGKFDLIRVDIGGEKPFTTKDGWDELLKKRYNIEDYGLPLVIFLDPKHQYKGNYKDGAFNDFSYHAKDSLGLKDVNLY